MASLKEEITQLAFDVGFDDIGFSPAHTSKQCKEDLKSFNAQGFHSTMDGMETTEERRADPQVLWPDARSIIVLGQNYGPKEDPLKLLEHGDRGVISCYAKNRDYHDHIKKKLKRLARAMVDKFGGQVKVFVDTAPVMEKPIAAQTKLGWQGKHTCVVSRTYGSWLFLGEIYTTLEIEPDQPETDHCGSCSRCLDICPTNAFIGAGQIDARRCISYLTIEHDGLIAPELAQKMGNRIYGCDDCLAICPWTKFSQPTQLKEYKPRAELQAPRLADLIELDDDAFRALFTASPIKRIKWHRFMRNVLIAVANNRQFDLTPKVVKLSTNENEVVAQTAQWVLKVFQDDPNS